MISIRLSRVGTKRAPVYRVVVMPKHNDPWAIATEILGHYNPRKNPIELVLNTERVKYWLGQGAETSDTMWNLLVDQKIVEGKKRSKSHISGTRAKKLGEEAAEEKAKVAEKAKKAQEEAAQAKEAAAQAKEAAAAAKEAARAAAEAPVAEAPIAEAPIAAAPVMETPAPTDNVGEEQPAS